jgi:hypothetical protein
MMDAGIEKGPRPVPKPRPIPKRAASRNTHYQRGRQPPTAASLQAAHDLFAPLDTSDRKLSSQASETQMAASEWAPMIKGTRLGFFDLTLLPAAITIRDCVLHECGDKRWVTMPCKAQIDAEGQLRKVDGKTQYPPVIEVRGDEARSTFQAAALAAVDQLIARQDEPLVN